MAGYLPSSGAISFNDISLIGDFASGSQRSLNDTVSRRLVGNTSGDVAVGSMYGRGVILNVNLASAFGNGVFSPSFSFSTSLPQFLSLPDGTQFFVQSLVTASWATINTNPTYTFTKGNTSTFTTGGSGGSKNYYMQTTYNAGNQTVYAYGYYSGESTSFPNGTVTIQVVKLI